ncbi:hypothetical protein R3P38DRAFT_3533212 [Favolaschia claudopus]|uniref:Uncharacterized protein n=1 Tax=Favolaschia claudopus TaxID=2862362 RepID=A0AAW0BFG9_9AGAR
MSSRSHARAVFHEVSTPSSPFQFHRLVDILQQRQGYPLYTPEIDEVVSRAFLGQETSRDSRKSAFRKTIDAEREVDIEGSVERALESFQARGDALYAGLIFGPDMPPLDATLKYTDVGSKYRLFYHPMFPTSPYPADAPYIFNVYIGRYGRSKNSILNWKQEPIVVKQQNLFGEWRDMTCLVAPASSRMRISFRESEADGQEVVVVHEFVFPPDPRENVRVHLLV